MKEFLIILNVNLKLVSHIYNKTVSLSLIHQIKKKQYEKLNYNFMHMTSMTQ